MKKIQKMKNKKITEIIPDISEHVIIKDFTTLHVGGIVDYFVETKTVKDLIRVVRAVVEYKIPYFILGSGSNILFSDYGFPGIVIKNSSSTIAVLKEKSQIIADSGVNLAKIILVSVANDLSGLEFLFGVPGTLGGALYGNAGAYGIAIGDYVKSLTILKIDPKDDIAKIEQVKGGWMEYKYRSSKIKKLKSKFKPVILSAKLQLSRNKKDEIMRKINQYRHHREMTQPIGQSAGCIFKNPIPQEVENVTGRGTKNMPEFPRERTAGYLLDQAGAKKLNKESCEVSNKHANFIINKNQTKASEIRKLIEEMREVVRKKYDITLEEEIEYVGQW
jgi:UDP-N-acetylmuramate dehydrogenase